MDLLFVHEGYSYGGAEKMIRWVAKQAGLRNHNVEVCYMYKTVKYKDDIPTTYLGLTKINNYLLRNFKYYTVGFVRLFLYLVSRNPQNIISFGGHSLIFLLLFKPYFRYRIIVSERGDLDRTRFPSIRRFLFSKCDNVVFQTPGARAQYDNLPDAKCVIIPNYVYVPTVFWSNDNAKDIIVNVGRLDSEQKKQDVLIKAYSLINKKHPNYSLYLVGDGSDRLLYENLVRNLNLGGKVKFVGHASDIESYLAKARIFVLSSDYEGLPNALMEAMAYGMPVISTDCTPGGARFLINDGKNGILVPRNDVQSLADAIIALIEDVALRKQIALNAKSTMNEFGSEVIANKWEEVYSITFI